MTPSNANTSGLEVVGYANPDFMRRLRNYRERREDTIRADETFLKAIGSESYPEPLVTAASAQARISELEAERDTWKTMAKNGAQALPQYVSRATAAEALFERVTGGLKDIRAGGSWQGDTASDLLAALQQEG